MSIVTMHEAKANLSRLVDSIESGTEAEIIIARNGRPAAKLVALEKKRRPILFGLAKGKFTYPDDFDVDNAMIETMFQADAVVD
jgi:prevent-host-death family protein